MNGISKRQIEILKMIKHYMDSNGLPPTRMEINYAFGFKSPNAAQTHLKTLAKKGLIELLPGMARGLRLTKTAANTLQKEDTPMKTMKPAHTGSTKKKCKGSKKGKKR